jgi:hypothetical protein
VTHNDINELGLESTGEQPNQPERVELGIITNAAARKEKEKRNNKNTRRREEENLVALQHLSIGYILDDGHNK